MSDRSPGTVLLRFLAPAMVIVLILAGVGEVLVDSHPEDILIVVGASLAALLVVAVWAASRLDRLESERQATERRFQHLVEQLPIAVYVNAPDRTTTNIYASPQIEQLLGYSAAEWQGDPDLFPRALHPEDRRRVLAAHARAHATAEPLSLEYRVVARDGRAVWVRDEGVVVDGPGGARVLQGAVLDVTEQKRVEAELREAEEKYRRLAESLPLVSYVVEFSPVCPHPGPSPPWLYLSPQIEGLLGHPASRFLEDPMAFFELVHPDDRHGMAEAAARSARTGENFQAEYRIEAADGRTVWIRDHAIVRDGENGRAYADGFLVDVTAEKLAEVELAAAERKYRALAEHVPVAMFTAPLRGPAPLLYASPQIVDLLGYPEEQWLSDPGLVTKVVHPDDRERMGRVLAKAHGEDGPFEAEFRVVTSDGRTLWVEDSTVVVYGPDDTPLYRHGYLRDITARKAYDRLAAAQQAVTSILAESPPVGEARRRVLAALCHELDWTWSALWRIERNEVFVQVETHAEGATERFEELARFTRFDLGTQCLPASVCKRGEPVWAEHFSTDRFVRSEAAARAGLRTAVGFPLMAGGEPKGAIEVFARDVRPRDEGLERLMAAIGGQVGDFLERAAAEERLRESEARLADAQRIAHIGSFSWDPAEDRTTWSDELLRIYGVDTVPSSFDEFLERDDHDRIRRVAQHALETHEPFALSHRIVRPDGEIRELEVEGEVVLDDERRPVRVTGVTHDVTDHVRAEAALRESERHFRAVFETNLDAMIILDDDGRYVDVNPAACELFGFERDELIGRGVGDLADEADRSAVLARWERFRHGGTLDGEQEVTRRDGERRSLWFTATANFLPGRHLSVSRDVTERNELEARLRHAQKVEAVGRLAGGVAHDFNNILLAIRGYAELALADLGPDGRVARSIEQIKESAERAASLTRQLLAFGRKQVLEPRPVDVNQLVSEHADLLRGVLGEGIELELLLDQAVGRILVDPVQLEQALFNLVFNARDAMEHGGHLTIATRSADGFATLSVADTGEGMDAATREHVFEPFFTTKVGVGTGLGLSSVLGFVEQSGGSVAVESELGDGSIFRLCFSEVEDLVAAPPPEVVPVEIEGSETVLLVEDERPVREMLATFLERLGYTVLEAENGERALELVNAHDGSLDVLVTDVVMPHLGGIELVHALKEAKRELPVVFLTGHAQDLSAPEEARAGSAVLLKPFAPAALAQAVRQALA